MLGRTTLIIPRRLVLGQGNYPRIKQVVGTVTAIHPDLTDPIRLSKVIVRTETGTQEIEAALVAGSNDVFSIR